VNYIGNFAQPVGFLPTLGGGWAEVGRRLGEIWAEIVSSVEHRVLEASKVRTAILGVAAAAMSP